MALAWEDRAILLSVRRHGEHDVIITVLSESHGRYAGMVKGGGSRRTRGVLQPGNLVFAKWRARVETQLGTVACELLQPFAAEALEDGTKLAGLSALCAVADAALPERETHTPVFARGLHLLEHLTSPHWAAGYALWELSLLRDMGYGLDLTACAATGVTDDLVFVSPKSGRAVSRSAGAPYEGKLFALPEFMKSGDPESGSDTEAASALKLTGYFLEAHVFHPHGRELPAARARFVERLGS
jgi:DNA repair protein RecO (recombination protein O)